MSAAKLEESHPFRSAEARDRYLRNYDKRAESWPVPSESLMVATSVGQTFVRVSGPPDAAPLMLLPGFGGDSLSWLPVIEALAADFRTYAVDHIYDNGRSISTRPVTSRQDQTQWLDELFEALAPGRPANLMGISRGGWLAAEYALHDPDRLRAVVLLAPAGVVLPASRAFFARFPLMLIPSRLTFGAYMHWLMPDAARSEGRVRALLDEFVDDLLLAARCFKARPPGAAGHDVFDDAELAQMPVPTLYVVGENERFCSAEDALRRVRTVAPDMAAFAVPNAGHDLLLVRPEAVTKRVLEFLHDQQRLAEQARQPDAP
jgi:pimeloyl-ACP methyl ester carboxylesterase